MNKTQYLAELFLKKALDENAKVRNRGDVVFSSEHPKVKDNKDHFPINNENQARNALARASQYSSAPDWYEGSLDSLVSSVARAVKSKYKNIEVSDAGKKPGKQAQAKTPVKDFKYLSWIIDNGEPYQIVQALQDNYSTAGNIDKQKVLEAFESGKIALYRSTSFGEDGTIRSDYSLEIR